MYEIDQGWWFVPNALNKFTVSERDNPKPNADGSLTLYFQNKSPGNAAEANWLTSSEGRFHSDAADVLAEGDFPLHSQRHLEAAVRGTHGIMVSDWPRRRTKRAPPRLICELPVSIPIAWALLRGPLAIWKMSPFQTASLCA